MSKNTLIAKPPTGFMRWFLRAPITLYRMGLGGLLGKRFMLINHVGRKSGQMRQTVVEVVAHDPSSNTYFIASGWGYKSNWYLNLMAQPEVTIQVGRKKTAVRAENLSPEAGVEILLDYRQRHAIAANKLGGAMGLDIGQATAEELANMIRESLPILALHPRN